MFITYFSCMKQTLLSGQWVLLIGWLSLWARAATAQVYYIDLAGQTLTLPDRTFSVEQVLDGRQDRAGIGTVHRGLANIPQPADLRPNVAVALTGFVQAQLPPRPTDRPVVLVVRELRLGERITTFSEHAQLDLAVDVYAHLADGFHYVLSAAELVESKGMETTAHHPVNLSLALQRCLAQCQTVVWDKLPAQPARTLAELQQLSHSVAPALSYAILTDSIRPRGYYPTFLAFRNNQPVTAPDLHLESIPRTAKGWEGTTEVVPYLQSAAGTVKEPLGKVWGFSDGKQLYLQHNKHYLPLTRAGNVFQFVGFSGADPGAVSTAGYLGGALGGAIAAAATAGRPVELTLDMMTGTVSPFADAGRSRPRRDTVTLYVYRPRGEPTAPSRLLLNGQFVGELADNSFLALPWTDPEHEPHLRLDGADGADLAFIPGAAPAVYIKVTTQPGLDADGETLERVPVKEGAFEVRAIKLRQQVEQKRQNRARL